MFAANHPKGTRGQFPEGYCWGAIILGIIFLEQSSRGQFSSGAIILGGNCPGGNNSWSNHPRGNCQGGIIRGGQFSSGAIFRTPVKTYQGKNHSHNIVANFSNICDILKIFVKCKETLLKMSDNFLTQRAICATLIYTSNQLQDLQFHN